MGQYDFLSVGSAVHDALEQQLVARAAKKRQVMLDQLTQQQAQSVMSDREADRALQSRKLDEDVLYRKEQEAARLAEQKRVDLRATNDDTRQAVMAAPRGTDLTPLRGRLGPAGMLPLTEDQAPNLASKNIGAGALALPNDVRERTGEQYAQSTPALPDRTTKIPSIQERQQDETNRRADASAEAQVARDAEAHRHNEIMENKPTGAQGAPIDSGDVARAASVVLSHKMSPSQATAAFGGMGTSAAAFKRAMNLEVVKQNPDFNFQEAESNYAFGKSAGTQTTVRFLDNIKKTIPMLRKANDAFKRSGIRFVNDAIKSGKSQIGDVDVADFDFKNTLLADEIAKVLQGGGTGSVTSDTKLKQATALLNGNMTAEQYSMVLDAAEEMLAVRRKTLTDGTYMSQPDEKPVGSGFKVVGSRPAGTK